MDGLWNNEKYRQEPAYQDDHRISGCAAFRSPAFKDAGFQTSVRVKYENGTINANRPRNVPPVDAISPWFRPVDNTSMLGGMGKLSVNNGY